MSGVVSNTKARITAYLMTADGPAKFPNARLLHIARMFEEASHNVKLDEEHIVDLRDGEIKIIPGISSSAPKVNIRLEGAWKEVVPHHEKTTAPLADIGNNTISVERALAEAKQTDPELASMIETVLLGVNLIKIDKVITQPTVEHSKGFSEADIAMLSKAKVVSTCSSPFALTSFKVPKKDGSARFITDCRVINENMDIFRDAKMYLPHLHDIMKWGVSYPLVWSIDANAYFFQFPLKGNATSWFPVRFLTDKGHVRHTVLSRLPMGFRLAPIIAQRVSNLVVNRATHSVSKLGVDAKVGAWVDNFMVFAIP